MTPPLHRQRMQSLEAQEETEFIIHRLKYVDTK